MKKLILFALLLACLVPFYFLEDNSSKTLNIYSARKEYLFNDILADFSEETGVKINFIQDKSNKLISRLIVEQENTQADIFIAPEILSLEELKNQDLLQPLNAENAKNVLEDFKDDDNLWVGTSYKTRSFFTKEKTRYSSQDSVISYENLFNNNSNDTILVRSINNKYNQALVANILYRYGENRTKIMINNLVKNLARKPQGGDTDQLKSLYYGIGDFAIANSYYYLRLLNSNNTEEKNIAEKLKMINPQIDNNGTSINISGVGIVKHSKNKDAANLFIDYLLSDKAQKFFNDNNFEYSIFNIQNILDYDVKALKHLYLYADEAFDIAVDAGWK